VENKTVAQGYAFTFGDRVVPGIGGFALFEVVNAEGIGGDQAVFPRVPPSRVVEIVG